MNRTGHDGELAALEAALEEEIGGTEPPDLWDRLQDRIDARQAPRERRWWPAAAILVAGLAVLFTVFSLGPGAGGTDGRDPKEANGSESMLDRNGPRSLDEARAWLQDGSVAEVSVRAHAVVETTSGARVPLELHPLENVFGSSNLISISGRTDRAAVIAALSAAPPAADVWKLGGEYSMTIRCGKRTVTVHVRGCSRFPAMDPAPARLSYAIAGRHEIFPIQPDARLTEVLDAERLVDLTETVLEERGIAVGDAGLRALPRKAVRMRCHGVTAAAVADLLRFEKLQILDLRFSTELHRAAVLQEIARLPLRSLVVVGNAIDRAGIAALGTMASLRELFFVDPRLDWLQAYIDGKAAAIDDDAAAHLARLTNLTELSIGGASITDAGLRGLAVIPGLKNLGVSHCPGLRGDGFDAFLEHGVSRLLLIGCDGLSRAGIDAIAQLPKLEELLIEVPKAADLRGLVSSPALDEIFVQGDVDARALEALGTIASLRKLKLRDAKTLGDGDLSALFSATQLERIEFINCPSVTTAGREALGRALPECRVAKDEW